MNLEIDLQGLVLNDPSKGGQNYLKMLCLFSPNQVTAKTAVPQERHKNNTER